MSFRTSPDAPYKHARIQKPRQLRRGKFHKPLGYRGRVAMTSIRNGVEVPSSAGSTSADGGRRQHGASQRKIRRNLKKNNHRFDIGQPVVCRINNGWARGIVVKHNYRESRWPAGETAPYQVKLDGGILYDNEKLKHSSELVGNLIYAPRDLDACIKEWSAGDGKIVSQGNARGPQNGQVHNHSHCKTGGCCGQGHLTNAGHHVANKHGHSHEDRDASIEKNTSEAQFLCDQCRHFFDKVYECAGCKKRSYCGRKCQKKAWKQSHKKECKLLQKNIAEMEMGEISEKMEHADI